MKMFQVREFDGPSICINADLITYVEPVNNGNATIVYFSSEDYITIDNSYDKITDLLFEFSN